MIKENDAGVGPPLAAQAQRIEQCCAKDLFGRRCSVMRKNRPEPAMHNREPLHCKCVPQPFPQSYAGDNFVAQPWCQ